MPPADRGRIGAARRWGPTRRLRIGDLTPDQRRLVLALIDAQRVVNAATLSTDPDAPPSGQS